MTLHKSEPRLRSLRREKRLQSLQEAWATFEFVLLLSELQMYEPASNSLGKSTPWKTETAACDDWVV